MNIYLQTTKRNPTPHPPFGHLLPTHWRGEKGTRFTLEGDFRCELDDSRADGARRRSERRDRRQDLRRRVVRVTRRVDVVDVRTIENVERFGDQLQFRIAEEDDVAR